MTAAVLVLGAVAVAAVLLLGRSGKPGPTGRWLSGQSHNASTQDGSFADWRGRGVEIGGAWASTDSAADAVGSTAWTIAPGAPHGNTAAMDYAVGAFVDGAGETWAAAATGAYDGRWRDQLVALRTAWGSRDPSRMFLRFAHEFNANWYEWRVPPSDVDSFVTAWRRWAELAREHFPGAKLVWSPNDGSSYAYDVRTLWPGDQIVDVVGIDSYNAWPWIDTEAGWEAKVTSTRHGGPLGIETYRQFAAERGKPFALSEWASAAIDSGGSGGGDAPVFMEKMNEWLSTHGGTGPGQVLYEVYFNVGGYAQRYELFPDNAQPQAAEAYRDLW